MAGAGRARIHGHHLRTIIIPHPPALIIRRLTVGATAARILPPAVIIIAVGFTVVVPIAATVVAVIMEEVIAEGLANKQMHTGSV